MPAIRILAIVLAGGLMSALALLSSGCGSSSEAEPRLHVYLSAPISGVASADGRDIADGARLALDDAGREAAAVPVDLTVLDSGGGRADGEAIAAANARRASEDSTAIAYIGELESGATRSSLPVTNEAGMLQVSAAASAVGLTREAPGSDQIPVALQPTGARTFGRVIPADTVQGAAAAAWMAESGFESVAIINGGSTYAESLVDGFESVSDGPSIDPSGVGADAFYEASDRLEGGARNETDGLALYASDAQLAGSPPRSALPVPARITSGALAPTQLPAAASDFLGDFEAAYGRDPGRFAAYGYEAMALAIDAIARADDPLDRRSVIDAFFATTDRDSVLGRYSIDEVGDTTLGRVGAYEAFDGGLRAARRPIAIP